VTEPRTYAARCHCGAVRFRFRSEEITEGRRCNCSICARKGIVMSARYYRPHELESIEGLDSLRSYRFGDHDVEHCFCATCGVYPFNLVAAVYASYDGPARPGDRRINLGCVEGVDVLALAIEMIDGRSY
jgi:hypothetical protein